MGLSLVELSQLWIRSGKTELLVHNILFLRKCISSMSESMTPAETQLAKERMLALWQPSVQLTLNQDIQPAAKPGAKKANSLRNSSQVKSSGNIFALLGQKLASSRKRVNNPSPANKSDANKVQASYESRQNGSFATCDVAPPSKKIHLDSSSVNVVEKEAIESIIPVFSLFDDLDCLSQLSTSSSETLQWLTIGVAEVTIGEPSRAVESEPPIFVPQRVRLGMSQSVHFSILYN